MEEFKLKNEDKKPVGDNIVPLHSTKEISSTTNPTPNPRKDRKFLITYTITLFSVAVIMLTLSYLYSSKLSEQSITHKEETQQLSLNALQTVETLQADYKTAQDQLLKTNDELDALSVELDKLADQQIKDKAAIAELNAKLTQTEREIKDTAIIHENELKSLELLRLADQNYRKGRKTAAKEHMTALAPLSKYLPTQTFIEGQPAPTDMYKDLVKSLGL